jgi:putative ABC transport system permease protein
VQMFVDHNYLSNLNLKLVAGKHFPDLREGREQFVIVNEEFLKKFEITSPVDALGETILVPDAGELIIIGVAKNFHYTDLKMPIQGFFFRYNPKRFSYANLKVTSNDMYTTLTNMETVWKSIGGEKKFEARFFDDEIEDAYAEYYSSIKIYSFLAFLAISISCLGLLGMVVYTTETRIKEIGVRKALGASTSTIAMLLSKDYLKLMLTAAIIATPITYFLFDTVLLGEHSNKIAIGALEIVSSILIMFLLGIGTILSQTLKASRTNPVDTLRYE